LSAVPDHPIIVFDALCVLCSGNAQFVLRHDKAGRFRLASQQSAAGAELYRRAGIDPSDPETMIVLTGGRVLRDSDAVIAILKRLGWPWRAGAALALVPRAVRNPIYRVVARNRYRLFGRRETCWLPDPAHRDRLL
jgi:predicted DCC family thiol-disulfide oxidoreductase YuxK